VKRLTALHIAYRWIGPPDAYLNAVPSRDLTGADLVGLEEREGITAAVILQSGLYEPAELTEVAPFCGAATEDGRHCRRLVQSWGQRCWQHKEAENGIASV